MSDEPVKECEVCGEPVKRLLFPVAIQFKGKGFYTTDYARRSSLGAAGSPSTNGGDSDSSSDRSAATESTSSSDNGKKAAPEASAAVSAAASGKSD
jgi:predicted nucleic acid-binding Zn ribbon protein